MSAPTPVITASGLGFGWPDGTPVLDGLDLSVGPGRSGLVGVNGAGKSTLLRLVAGELRPTSGQLHVSGEVGYLPQDLTPDAAQPVASYDALVSALASYRGALVVASHDAAFLHDIGVDRVLDLGQSPAGEGQT
jgi:ATPase subunit of ABC transporter with duplicated ATPase domains